MCRLGSVEKGVARFGEQPSRLVGELIHRGTSICNFLFTVDEGVVHGEERQSSGWSCLRWRAADRASAVRDSAERSG